MTPQAVAAAHWTERRRRAAELAERWPFATEVLTFYGALLDAQARACDRARAEVTDPSRTVPYAVAHILPIVRAVSTAAGPGELARAGASLPSGDVSAGQW